MCRRCVRSRPARTLVVLGSGGHTTEILSLCRAMDVSRYVPATFVVADSDHLSEARAEDTLLNTAWVSHRDRCRFWRVPRAREVGQSWLSTVGTTAFACAHAFGIVTTVRPELILVNGPVRDPQLSLCPSAPLPLCPSAPLPLCLSVCLSLSRSLSCVRACVRACVRGARACAFIRLGSCPICCPLPCVTLCNAACPICKLITCSPRLRERAFHFASLRWFWRCLGC